MLLSERAGSETSIPIGVALNLTFVHHFIRYRLVFRFIPCNFVCELIIYDVTFLLILLLGYIIIIPTLMALPV